MPWKEPGEKPRPPREPRGREPWGQGGRGGGPDLDAWLKKARRALGPFGHGPAGALAVLVLLVVLWFIFSGWTIVGAQQVGVQLRFGRLVDVLPPGVHAHFPAPIDEVRIVDTGRTRNLTDEVRLLTADGQLALVDYFVQYKVADAREFLYATRDAEETARNAAGIAARAVVGTHTLRQLLDRSDNAFGDQIRTRLVAALARAGTGITVTGVGIQNVGVPSEVKQAFDGIAKAHEDAKTADASAKADVARGKVEAAAQAASLKTEADAYRTRVVAQAQAEVARFAGILGQYDAAPQVTRHQLWLSAMRDVLSRNHVVLNTGTGSVIVQFPERREAQPAAGSSSTPAASGASVPASSVPASATTTITVPVTSGPSLRGGGA